MTHEIALIGASGFVGRAVHRALIQRGHRVRTVRAPRLAVSEDAALLFAQNYPEIVGPLTQELKGCSAIINCAGNPDASSRDAEALFGANAALPGVIAEAAHDAGAFRLVHVSSAAVQGAALMLDSSERTEAFSDYARSKVTGEQAVACATSPRSTVIYRPPSVHSPERRVTRGIRRLARSPFASVMGVGDSPTPQAHIDNVGDAVAELATTKAKPPTVVIHPWEGWTTGDLMRVFGGGREPRHLPAITASAVRGLLRLLARSAYLAPNARRVEIMWFGQRQDASWLIEQGWTPPTDRSAWTRMVVEIDLASREKSVSNSKGNDD